VREKKFVVHAGCKHFIYTRPCMYHKLYHAVCAGCKYFVPLKKCGKVHPENMKSVVKRDTNTVLIIKLGAKGDVLRTTFILRYLRKKCGRAVKISWLVDKGNSGVLENNGLVNNVIHNTAGVTRELLKYHWLEVINLDLDKKAVALAGVLSTDKRVGFWLVDGELRYSNNYAEYYLRMSYDDNLKKSNRRSYQQIIAGIVGMETKKVNFHPIAVYNTKERKVFHKPNVVLAIGCGGVWGTKQWPVAAWEKVVCLLHKKYRDNIDITISGDKSDYAYARKIIEYSKKCGAGIISLVNRMTIPQLYALIDNSSVVVASDTLTAHVAYAFDKPVITLFGPTSSAEVELGRYGKKIVAPLPCIVCYRRVCDKKPFCMDAIKPEVVFNQIVRLLC